MKTTPMERLLGCFIGLAFVAAISAFVNWIIWLLWNHAVAPTFSWPHVNFLPCWGIVIFIGLLCRMIRGK